MTLGGGVAAATGDRFARRGDGDDDDEGNKDGDTIDPVSGYPATDIADVPERLVPAHEVALEIAPLSEPAGTPFLYFDPAGLHVDPGDVVQFTFLSPDHTVTAYHPEIGLPRRVPAGAEPFSSPVMGPGAAWLYPFEHECVYNVYWAPHNNFGMAMRLVVGDLGENDDLEYAETDEGLPSREDVSGSLDELSERNEGCERPFQMPAGVLGTDALAAANTRDEGGVSFEMVATELGYDFVPSEERKRRPTTKLPVGSPPR